MRPTIIGAIAGLTLAVAACGGDSGADTTMIGGTTGGDAVHGLQLYQGSCTACHGEAGIGIPGLGKPWVGSEFINSRTDAEMLAFLQVGRPADDPSNTTGIAMLPRGGNPNLTDADLMDLVAYMRSLNP